MLVFSFLIGDRPIWVARNGNGKRKAIPTLVEKVPVGTKKLPGRI
jgi:hypothetical protein